VWLAAALLASGSGVVARLRPPAPQILLLALTAALLVSFWTAWREWARAVDLRALVLVHVTRLVGFYFLALYGRGELPYAFAVPGGIGDITVALTALALAAWMRPGRRVRGPLLAWNVFGLADITMVVVTAARLAMADPGSMGALLRLPLSLLPTFLVPIIIATHVLIFARVGDRPI
jgi:hypothetical protein